MCRLSLSFTCRNTRAKCGNVFLGQMELRYKEVERARNIFERYVRCLPTVKAWVRFAKFEMQNGEVARARRCYERAVEELGDDAQTVISCPSHHRVESCSSWIFCPCSPAHFLAKPALVLAPIAESA